MTEYYEPAKVCKLLPYEIRMGLVRAATQRIPQSDPLARVKAIEEAAARARRNAPHLFSPC